MWCQKPVNKEHKNKQQKVHMVKPIYSLDLID